MVAVLINKFSAEVEDSGADNGFETVGDIQDKHAMGYVLDPLLATLAEEYNDRDNLTRLLSSLFRVLADSSAYLSKERMCRGISALQCNPPIHFAEFDFNLITINGFLALPNGGFDQAGFVKMMQAQVHDYLRRKLQVSMAESWGQKEFATMACIKLLNEEVQVVKTDLSQGLKSLKLEMRSMKKLMLSCVEKLKGDEQEMRILKEDAEQAKTDLEPTAYTASFPTAGGKHPRGPHPPRPTSRSRGGSSRSGASTYKRPADTPHGGAADKRPKTHAFIAKTEQQQHDPTGRYQDRNFDPKKWQANHASAHHVSVATPNSAQCDEAQFVKAMLAGILASPHAVPVFIDLRDHLLGLRSAFVADDDE